MTNRRQPPHPLTALRFLAVAVLVTLIGFAPAPPASVALAPASDSDTTLDVLVEGGSVVQPGTTVTVRVSLRAAESQPLASQAIRLSLTEDAFETESQLRRFLDQKANVPLSVVGVRQSPEVLQLETSDVRIGLTAPGTDTSPSDDPEEAPLGKPKIFGLQADFIESIDDPDGPALLSQRQALIVIPAGALIDPARIAPIVPIIIPPTGGQTLSAEELDSYASSGGVLDRMFGTLSRHRATIAVDSRITLSLEALGDQAPTSGLRWQENMDALPAPVISLPWADADPLATIAIDTLLYGRLGQYPWLHAGVSSEQLEEVSQRSADAILVPSSVVDSDRTIVQLQSAKMIRVDESMSGFIRQAATAASEDETEAALQRAHSLVVSKALNGSGEAIVFHTGRLPVTASVIRIEEILERVSSFPFGQVIDVPFDTPASEIVVEINETPMPREWTVFTTQVLGLWDADVQYVSIADNPEEAILGRWNRYQALFSSAWDGNPTGRDAEWQRAEADSETFRSSVRIEEGSAFTVLSDRTELPLVIRNDLRSTVRVQLIVTPQRAIVGVENPIIPVTIPAESTQRVSIPITALASGTAPLTLSLHNASGEAITEPIDIQVTIRAGWENVITGVLAALIGIVFAVGIYRAIQRRRQPESSPSTGSNSDDKA